MERIASSPQTANPLYLRALLEELRVYGDPLTLDQRIVHYLEAQTVPALYERILERYEQDYEHNRPGLVRDAMTCLWAARRGFSETELLELLGANGQPLPRAHWSPLYLVAEQALVSRSGFLSFFHDHLREAVQHRYLPGEQDRQAAHLWLAHYFAAAATGRRLLDELPWQLAAAAAWPALYTLLSDLAFFHTLRQADQFSLEAYWTQLEENGFIITAAYRPVLDQPEKHPTVQVAALSEFLDAAGHSNEALLLTEHIVEHCRNEQNEEGLAGALSFKADMSRTRGDLETSLTLYGQARQLFLAKGGISGVATTLGNEALVHKDKGELDQALQLHREAENFWQELGDRKGLMFSVGNQGVILYMRGELENALSMLRRQELICRELGNKEGLQACLGNQALVLMDQGNLDSARLLMAQQERICRELGRKFNLANCLGNQAALLIHQGKADLAVPMLEEQERICHDLGDKAGLSRSLSNQGAVARRRGEYKRAMELLKRVEQIDREMGHTVGLACALLCQGNVYYEIGDLDMAMSLYKESEKLCRQMREPKGIVESLSKQASLLWGFPERRDEARHLLAEAHSLASHFGFHALLETLDRARSEIADISSTINHEQNNL
ncbi:MAG: tetratricopeptide repeat protein [Verrucomicrobia bacterium]|nr:tetratricopeptide repeat protein [Verrucomicrobiota bacterium]